MQKGNECMQENMQIPHWNVQAKLQPSNLLDVGQSNLTPHRWVAALCCCSNEAQICRSRWDTPGPWAQTPESWADLPARSLQTPPDEMVQWTHETGGKPQRKDSRWKGDMQRTPEMEKEFGAFQKTPWMTLLPQTLAQMSHSVKAVATRGEKTQ